MNAALLVAAALIVILGAAHSYLGERYILVRLFRRADLPQLFGSDDFTKRTLRFAWHLTTVAWMGLGGLVLLLAGSSQSMDGRQVGLVIAATAALSALVSAIGSRGRHPSWLVLALVAVAVLIGLR